MHGWWNNQYLTFTLYLYPGDFFQVNIIPFSWW